MIDKLTLLLALATLVIATADIQHPTARLALTVSAPLLDVEGEARGKNTLKGIPF